MSGSGASSTWSTTRACCTLSQRIDALDAQVRSLRGEIEELQNSNDTLRKQQRDLYADLDRRLAACRPAAKSGAGRHDRRHGRRRWRRGRQRRGSGGLRNGVRCAQGHRLRAARSRSFQEFLRTYPQSQLADNAQYWLGERRITSTRDYDNAASAFRAVGEQYPQSRKAPDALLKLGLTQIDQKKLTDARATLKQVVQRYPGTDAAKLAASRLQGLPPDEH